MAAQQAPQVPPAERVQASYKQLSTENSYSDCPSVPASWIECCKQTILRELREFPYRIQEA